MRIAFEGVTKQFQSLRGRTVALDGLSFDIADGEFFVLLGPSGCGKSTTLNLIAGLEAPTGGRITFDDRVVASVEGRRVECLSPKERGVAMVFQTYALYPHLTVYENIAFPLRIAKEGKEVVDARVRQAAETLHITELLPSKPGELSGGQRQRVAIARAIVRRPAVFLLDEPLSNLDAQLRASTRVELKRLQRELGVTTVYVTHDQTEAMTLGDRIAVLKDGRLEQVGVPADLYDRPANPFVASFIGSPPMNLIEAPVTVGPDTVRVQVGELHVPLPGPAADAVRREQMDQIILGLRPEHITVQTPPDANCLAGDVTSVEPLGRELLLHVACGPVSLSALTTHANLKPGDSVGLRLVLARAHLFRAGNRPENCTRICD